MIKLIVPGEPVAKARPRWAQWGIYTPKKTVNYEMQIRERFATVYPRFVPFSEALRVEMIAYMGIPISQSQKKKALMKSGKIRPVKRPDIDNILKVIDALSGIAFRDDRQIVEAEMKKFYSNQPRLEIRIMEIKEQGGEK
jgi:Holliday junction resolvase RusA-like endonuclease